MILASWFRRKLTARPSGGPLSTTLSGILTGAAFLTMLSPAAQAKVFYNAYVSFELPDKWDCTLEQTEYVCRTSAPGVDSREAIIILTAKEVGPSDQLPLYMQHLKQARTIASRAGQSIQSQVYKVDQAIINGQPWIDGMHISSEVPNYYTRYLATTKDRIAILVTFSAHKLFYTKYNNDFFRAIQSLRVVADKSAMHGNNGGGGPGGSGGGILGPSGGVLPNGDTDLPMEGGEGHESHNTAQTLMGLSILILGIGAYFYLKKDKTKKKKKRPPQP